MCIRVQESHKMLTTPSSRGHYNLFDIVSVEVRIFNSLEDRTKLFFLLTVRDFQISACPFSTIC